MLFSLKQEAPVSVGGGTFTVASDIFEKIPNLYIGVVAAKGVDNHREYPEIEEKLCQTVAAAQQRFADTGCQKSSGNHTISGSSGIGIEP